MAYLYFNDVKISYSLVTAIVFYKVPSKKDENIGGRNTEQVECVLPRPLPTSCFCLRLPQYLRNLKLFAEVIMQPTNIIYEISSKPIGELAELPAAELAEMQKK